MKLRIIPGVLLLILFPNMPSPAQEKPPQERRPGRSEQLPAPEELAGPGCTPPCPEFKILWLEQQKPITRLVAREETTTRKSPTFVVAYREEHRQVCDMVLRSREVDRVISCYAMKDVTEIDPSSGQPVTVQKPVLETRTVKEIEYYPAPQNRTVVVMVPYLKPAEEMVSQKTVLFEYHTDMEKVGYAVRARGGEVLPDRMIAVPHPCEPELHPQSCRELSK